MTSNSQQNGIEHPLETEAKPDCAADSITVLLCSEGFTASKRFVRGEDGIIQPIPYNAGKYFSVVVWPVSDIFTLSARLMAVEGLPMAFVIRGAPRNPPTSKTLIRRLKENFATPEAGRRWAMIDFDKITLPDGLDLTKDTSAVIEHMVSILPPEFHDCSYHYQLSSSAGMGDPRKASAHVWFWLSEPWSDANLKVWANAVNNQAGRTLIDTALFNDVQAHYTAAPIFEGVDNPFPVRSALVQKTNHSVSIHAIEVPESTLAARPTGPFEPGPGFDEWLERIGDHPGGDGFHEPIMKASASYARTHGRDGTDVEALYEIIRNRVLTADQSKHDDKDIEKRASREYILPLIESAIKKYGDQPPSRRRSRLVEGVSSPVRGPALSAADAFQALLKLINFIVRGTDK